MSTNKISKEVQTNPTKVLNIQITNDISKIRNIVESRKQEKSYAVTEFIIPNHTKIVSTKFESPLRNRKETEKKKHLCEFCSKSFMWKSLLDEHRRTHTKEKPHKCRVCGAGFGSYAGLWKHKVVHVDVKPFECQVCHKWFKRSVQLKYHTELHTGTKLLKCDFCDYSTISRRCMQLHRDTHKSKLKFVCEICNKGFNAKTYLTEHLNMHSGLRPFLCGKSYQAKTSLLFHFQKKHRSHTEDKKFNICGSIVDNEKQEADKHSESYIKQKNSMSIYRQNFEENSVTVSSPKLHSRKNFLNCSVRRLKFSTKALVSFNE